MFYLLILSVWKTSFSHSLGIDLQATHSFSFSSFENVFISFLFWGIFSPDIAFAFDSSFLSNLGNAVASHFKWEMRCYLNRCSFMSHVSYFPGCFQVCLFFTLVLRILIIMSLGVDFFDLSFLWVCSAFRIYKNYVLHQIWKVFRHYFFEYIFSCALSSPAGLFNMNVSPSVNCSTGPWNCLFFSVNFFLIRIG